MILVEIAGHLGQDAEVRFTPSGTKITKLRIAAKSRRGQNETTLWWTVNLWGDRWDKMEPFLKKGAGLIVIGEMAKPEIYQSNKDGSNQVALEMTAEIVRFSPFGRSRNQEDQGSFSQQQAPSAPSQQAATFNTTDHGDDDLPF